MKKIHICFIILLVALGCRKNDNNNNQHATSIFPGKVGDTWLYLVDDTAFNFQNPGTISQYNMTISVVDSIQLPGGIHATIWVYNYPAGTDTNYVFQNGDTIAFAADTMPNSDIVRRYVIPLRLHDSWQYSTNSIHDVTVDSQSNIIVGQHQFDNAFHIHGYPGRPDEMYNIDEWLADNVGVVKRYFNNVNTTTNPYRHITTWSLVSYHLQ